MTWRAALAAVVVLAVLPAHASAGTVSRAGGVVAKAAAELGMSRQALYRRMERLGITLERRVRT